MEPSVLPELKDMSYADYADAVRREAYLKTSKQSGIHVRGSANPPGKDAVDAGPIKKTGPAQDPAH